MENLKLPVALVAAMAIQLAGGVWWVSQQASTISDLEETVSQLGSKMAIEDNINMKRDVKENSIELEYIWTEIDDLWTELDNLTLTISRITDIQQRIAVLEKTLEFVNKDHSDMMDFK